MANYHQMAGSPISEENQGPVGTMRSQFLLRSPSLSKRRALELISNIFRKKNKDKPEDKGRQTDYPIDTSHDGSGRRRSTPILRAQSPNQQMLCKPQLSMRDRRSPNTLTTKPPLQPSSELNTLNCSQQAAISRPMAMNSAWSPSHSPDLRYQSYSSLFSNSPISPRVRSIDEDIEALTLSRQDNPYLSSQLERISATSGLYCDFLSMSDVSLSAAAAAAHTNTNTITTTTPNSQSSLQHESFQTISRAANEQPGPSCLMSNAKTEEPPSVSPLGAKDYEGSLVSIELDEILSGAEQNNVHEHLIRSPPPQFPQNFREFFIFPDSFPENDSSFRSPIRTLSLKHRNQPSSSQPHLNQRGRSRQFNSQLLSPLRSRSATQQTASHLSIRPELASSANVYLDSHLI